MNSRALSSRSVALRASSLTGSRLSVRRVGLIRRPDRRAGFSLDAYLGQYLSEAVQKIFSVADDEPVQWQKMAAPFEGKISQRDHSSLRQLHKVVETVKGCTDPGATNFNEEATLDDGSCIFEPGAKPSEESMQDYLKTAVQGIFAHQFKGDDTEPKWPMAPFNGQIHSQRDIERMVSFGKVVKKTLDEAEVE